MENFSNLVIAPENLPEIQRDNFSALDKKYRTILLIRVVIMFLIMAGGVTTFLLLADENVPGFVKILAVSGAILFTALPAIFVWLGFPKKGYLVRENDISFQKGLITYKLTTIPFNRIQHVEVNKGILGKIFGLSSVKIYTAGGMASDLSIPGLPDDDALRLKAFLSEKISEHE